MILDPKPFRIDDMLRDLSSAASGGFGEPPIGLRFDVDPALPRHLVGDVLQLRQVLGELCGDAVRFADKGPVVLSLAMIQRSASAVTVEFALRGTGVGAAGSSLTASQGQVALLGGELKAESVPGEGSRLHFCLTLPVVRGPADDGAAPMPIGAAGVAGSQPAPPDPARRHAGAAEGPLAGMRILVVEDDRTNQLMARGMLEADGARVWTAANGQEAVAAVAGAEPPFDAVLMDLQMPVLDGLEATGRIRLDLGLKTLPIVATTANVTESDRKACLAAGMDDHVGKPFDRRHLVAVLHRLAGRSAAQDPAAAAASPPAGVGGAAFAAGVDISAAMTRFGDNVVLYRRTLSMFVKELPARPAQLAALVAGCETEPALRWLHTLKGQAATIGASGLSVAAADAETRLAADATASGIAVAARMAGAALADAGPGLEALLQALQAAETPGADLPPDRR